MAEKENETRAFPSCAPVLFSGVYFQAPATQARKDSKNPQVKRKREVGLEASHKNYINWRRLKPDLFDGQEHGLKSWDACCIVAQRSKKKSYVLFAKARHVILKGFPWSLTIPIPLPTGSKPLARKPSLNLNLSQPRQEKTRESTDEGKERGQAKH